MRIIQVFAWLFAIAISTASSLAQTLKSGDSLNITVLQDPKLDRSVVVDPTGKISFPLAGHIRARGMSLEALERALTSRLKENYKDGLDITVAFVSANKEVPEEDLKPRIYVTGEVARPGPYILRQSTTLIQAISLAGGVGTFAAKRRIQVRRRVGNGDETIYVFDYSAYEVGQNIDANIALRTGDVILVPERGLFE